MPRQVDHDERRDEIARAVWAVVATRGLDAVSLRTVASEAGVSVGRVQHYFATKDEMLLFAARAMATAAARTVGAADSAPQRDPRESVRSALVVGVPVDDARRLGASVWFAFVAKAAVWPELAEVVEGELAGGRRWLAGELTRAAEAGRLRPGVDAAAQALALSALADGLVLRVLVRALTPAAAVAAVDDALARVFTD